MSNQVELTSKDQLNAIIVNKNGKPYKTAIEIYWYLRSWYDPVKAKKSDGTDVRINKLHTDGIHLSKEKLSAKFNISKDSVRRALACLEELGLISRGFEKKGISVNHLVLYVWKNTSHFYNRFGVIKEQVVALKRCTTDKSDVQKIDKYSHKNSENKHTPILTKVRENQKRDHTLTPDNTKDAEAIGYVQNKHTPPVNAEKIENQKMSTPQKQSTQGIESGRGVNAVSIPPMLKNSENKHTPYAQNKHTYNKGKKIEISPKDISISSSRCYSELNLENKTKPSQAKNPKTEFAKKSPTAEFSEETAKTSYAYEGDKVLPQSPKSSNEFADGNLALAKNTAQTDTAELVETSEQRLAKGKNDNSPTPLATPESFEPEQSISEEEHYQIAADIPSPETEATPPVQESATAKPEVKSFSADNEGSDNSGNVKQTLSCEDHEDAKWKDIRKFVLEKFKRKEELAYGILHNLTITAIRPNRIGLSFDRDLGFSEEDKDLLRSCLRDVYGPLIEMVIMRPDEDISSESAKLKVHLISEDDKRLPEGLKKQFEQLGTSCEITPAIEKPAEDVVEPDDIRRANKDTTTDLATEVFDEPLAYAKNKWGSVMRGIIDGVYGSYAKQMENYLSNVEVLGMTGRVLRLEAWWLTCDKMKDQQDLVERTAKKHDVDLEIKNKQDGDILYMPWTYPTQKLPPLELGKVIKKVNDALRT